MLKSSKSQDISGTLNLGAGDLQIDGKLKTGSLSNVAFDTIFNKYEYDAGGSTHNLKTAFNFKGSLASNKLESPKVRSRVFDNFVADAISKSIQNSGIFTVYVAQLIVTSILTLTNFSISRMGVRELVREGFKKILCY